MIKLVYAIRRRPDLSPEAFRARWLEHAPLVERFAAAMRARRYVQSHTIETSWNDVLASSRGAQPPYDGITEVWWDDLDALAAALATPEGQEAGRALLEDERAFIDLAASSLFLTEEHEIFDR
ncbi:MAG TPA: EthD domain-containing protein [Sandaracinaceae bacterium]